MPALAREEPNGCPLMKGLPIHHHPQRAVNAGSREAALVRRIRTLINDVDLDCECRSRLDEALSRFTALEDRRTVRRHLTRARQHRERIKVILDFLQEIDDLLPTEPDRSVYAELALLFEEVAAIATEGAGSMHELAMLRAEQAPKDAGG